jgi:tryptophan synthase alpha chain
MQRIHDAFARTRDCGGALIIYITAGDPSLDDTVELALAAERGGGDIIELGIPYSSPVADGPVIQEACRRALEGGATVRGVLAAAAQIRERSEAPLVLMTAFNPVLIFGLEKFAAAASEAGVDGVLISDLPPSEAGAWSQAAAEHDLGTVLLVAPDNTDEQMRDALAMTTGFCYVVSRPGTTGARADLYEGLRELVARANELASVPVAVGFGLSDADQVREVLAMADGAIVGSAIVRIIAEGNADGGLVARVQEAVAALR